VANATCRSIGVAARWCQDAGLQVWRKSDEGWQKSDASGSVLPPAPPHVPLSGDTGVLPSPERPIPQSQRRPAM